MEINLKDLYFVLSGTIFVFDLMERVEKTLRKVLDKSQCEYMVYSWKMHAVSIKFIAWCVLDADSTPQECSIIDHSLYNHYRDSLGSHTFCNKKSNNFGDLGFALSRYIKFKEGGICL